MKVSVKLKRPICQYQFLFRRQSSYSGLWVVILHHEVIGEGPDQSSHVRHQPGDPEEVVGS